MAIHSVRSAPPGRARRAIQPSNLAGNAGRAATVLISVFELDQDHGWTPEAIRAILEGDRREEGP